MTDLSTVADLLDGSIVESPGVATETLERVRVGDAALSILTADVAGLDAVYPCDMAGDIGLWLQSDNVLAGDSFPCLVDWVGPCERKGAPGKSEGIQA
jgi:hypothetical protein